MKYMVESKLVPQNRAPPLIQSQRGRRYRSSVRGRAGAFTLVEMLVIIAAIAVLASMLLPAFTRGKARAHQVRCNSNLRQLNLALGAYRDDNNTEFPPLETQILNIPGSRFWFWADNLESYCSTALRNRGMHCPAYRGAITHWSAWSYGYNAWGSWYPRNYFMHGVDRLGLGRWHLPTTPDKPT